ncbi:MAG: AAA family ATPase, partial [Caldisericum sp.]|nr:AAA family ATPase [Caldisericum sp.]
MHPTIKEIVLALDAEIKELKEGHSGRTISVFDGIIVQESSNSYIYQFVVDNVFSTMDDTPAEIEVNGKNYRCYIVTIEGQNVVLSLDENLGNKIPSAKLKINTWYLLEELKRKFEESADDSKKFTSSLKLFSGEASPIHSNIYLLENDNFFIGNELDESQKEAVKASLLNSFCIIWGPPGTGKTKTIVKLIEGHIKLGRRVLLVSHSNNAVDEAMLRIGEKFRKSSIYEEGKLVRFGNIKPEYLQKIKEENLDLIRFDEIFKKKSENLLSEKSRLTGELTTLNTKLEKAQEAKKLYNFIQNIDYKINATEKILNEKTQILSYLNEQIEKLLEVKAELQNRLLKANESNALKRLFLGLNPEVIKARLEKLEEEIMSKRQQERELENSIVSLKAELSTLQIKKGESQKYLEDSLKNLSVSIREIDSYMENLKSKIEALKSKISDIQKALDKMQLGILEEALVVGTTLTMTYIAKVFETLSFDVLVVDEVSMAPQPMLFWAASKASTAITIVGDFMQLPPISVSKNEFAHKWLVKSIFDTLGINDVKRVLYDNRIKLLKTQYRMHPSISKISNKFIYQEVINDRKTDYKEVEDKISGNKPVILVDTSSANPWASQAFSGGRFNLYNALLCVNLAESILPSLDNNQRVGIVTPYRHQANLILRIAKDKGIENRVRVGVIHNFQGSEEEVI